MKIYGITGRAGAGKDSLARYLIEHHGYVRISFADPIRRFVGELTDLPFEAMMEGPAKEAPLDWLNGVTPRQMMQTLGTDWGREMVDPELWLKVAARAVRKARQDGAPGVVFPDVRFDNEAEFVKQLGGEIVLILRENTVNVGAHKSEAGVSPGFVTHMVRNDDSLTRLAFHAAALAQV